MTSIDNTLAERGKRYGEFPNHAEITQGLKEVMWATPNWKALADDQKEALEMTAHKIGRILNGDPNYIDSWTDIGGYIRLVEKRLMDAEVAHSNKAQDETISTLAREAKAHATDAKKSVSAINDLIKELVDSEFGFRPAPELDRFDEKLISELKKVFGNNIEVVHINGQGS